MSDEPTAADFAAFDAATGFKRAGSTFGTCTCGRPICEHSRIKPSGNPDFQYVCPFTESGVYSAQDGSRWPHGPAGIGA